MSGSALSPEVESLKSRLKNIWMAGDYDRISRYTEGGARDFYERLNVAPGCQLLDVGCGSGRLALIAAKDGLEVTGVDIASNLVQRGQARARLTLGNSRIRKGLPDKTIVRPGAGSQTIHHSTKEVGP